MANLTQIPKTNSGNIYYIAVISLQAQLGIKVYKQFNNGKHYKAYFSLSNVYGMDVYIGCNSNVLHYIVDIKNTGVVVAKGSYTFTTPKTMPLINAINSIVKNVAQYQ